MKIITIRAGIKQIIKKFVIKHTQKVFMKV